MHREEVGRGVGAAGVVARGASAAPVRDVAASVQQGPQSEKRVEGAPAEQAGGTSEGAPLADAGEHPLVKKALEVFGGKVVDVQAKNRK